MRHSVRSSVTCLALLAATASCGAAAAQVQTVTCGGQLTESAGMCVGTVARSDSVQQFKVELRVWGRGNAGVPVVFKADSGALVRDSVVTDANGIASTTWHRPRGTGPARIAADVRAPGGSILKYIQLSPRATPLTLRTAQDTRIANFPGGTGRRLVVQILRSDGPTPVAITDSVLCAEQRVAFIPEGTGARATPDTAAGEIYKARPRGVRTDYALGCFARSRFAVGSEVGLHEIRTIGVPATGYRVVENATLHPVNVRPLPQIVVAGVGSGHSSFRRLEEQTVRTYRVQRTLPSGETATFDSTVVALSTAEGGGTSLYAMVGLSSPIPLGGRVAGFTDWFGLTLGVDPDKPKESQFMGFSVLRSGRLVPHNFTLDLHVLLHHQEFKVLKTPATCASALTAAACGTRTRQSWAPAVAVSFDAAAALADVIKKLGA